MSLETWKLPQPLFDEEVKLSYIILLKVEFYTNERMIYSKENASPRVSEDMILYACFCMLSSVYCHRVLCNIDEPSKSYLMCSMIYLINVLPYITGSALSCD